MIKFTEKQVIILHSHLITRTGGEIGIRDTKLLQSAIYCPFQSFDNIDLYPTVQEKGARLGYGIIKNHPFVDGNKRTGAHVMLLFLDCNDVELCYTQEELIDCILQTATSDNYKILLKWITEHQM